MHFVKCKNQVVGISRIRIQRKFVPVYLNETSHDKRSQFMATNCNPEQPPPSTASLSLRSSPAAAKQGRSKTLAEHVRRDLPEPAAACCFCRCAILRAQFAEMMSVGDDGSASEESRRTLCHSAAARGRSRWCARWKAATLDGRR